MFKFIDGHCDTITTALESNSILFENDLQIDIKRLQKYNCPTQVFSVWCANKYLDDAFSYTDNALTFFDNEIKSIDCIEYAYSAKDIENNMKSKKISAILALEGGEALEGKIENLEYFYEKGVRILTLCWNRENELGYGSSCNVNSGLKSFGKECVKKMNELDMIIDVSHLNKEGFWDTFELSSQPFIASHSNAFNQCKHSRNLTDDQIKAIVDKGGMIGINLYPKFLHIDGYADISDIIRHIEHFIKITNGYNLGIGCDFDGIDKAPRNISNILDLTKLFVAIEKYFDKKIAKRIMFENYFKFFTDFFQKSP